MVTDQKKQKMDCGMQGKGAFKYYISRLLQILDPPPLCSNIFFLMIKYIYIYILQQIQS